MIESERAASLLHGSLVESVAEAQKRIVLHEAILKRFDDVVPQQKLLQSRNCLQNGRERMQDMISRDELLITEYVASIRELESIFDQKEKADIEEMVAGMVRRHGFDQKNR